MELIFLVLEVIKIKNKTKCRAAAALFSKVLCDESIGFDQISLSLVELLVTCIPSSIISTLSLDTFSHVVLHESRDISIVCFKKASNLMCNSVLKSTGVCL